MNRSEIWNGKMKAVTFSYDDGVTQDRRLVELFNRYHLKGTFNLNSGIMSGASSWMEKDVEIHRLNAKGMPEIYTGHEIAVHCLTHADLTRCDEDTIRNEIILDKENLERMFYCEIEGMAYPYGNYNNQIVEILKECGIKYARGVRSKSKVATPEQLLTLRPTMHHMDEHAFEIIENFLSLDETKLEKPQMLYIWGHSYEFDVRNNWDRIEKICELVSGKSDVFYGTNAEVLRPFYEA